MTQLFASRSRKIAAFLHILKETGMRCGEAWRMEWVEVDMERNVVTVNKPEKQGVPRQCKISIKLVAMLNTSPKTSQRVFEDSPPATLRKNFMQ